MAFDPVGFAIVSPARWGLKLLDAARNSDKLVFRGVYSRSAETGAAVTATYGGRAYASYEAVLADPAVEAVLLPTPNFLHHPQAMAAFAAGKHVFVEKPIANTLAEAEDMRRTSEARGLVLACGKQGRRTGAARKVWHMLHTGELGQVAVVAAVHGAPILDGRAADSWYVSAESAPGGPLDQLGVHYFDLLHYWFGPIRRVTGFTYSGATPHSVTDSAVVALLFASGLVGSYTTQQVSAYVSNLSIYGTRGAVHFNRFGQELLWQDVIPSEQAKQQGAVIRPIPFEGPHPFTTALQEELEEFAACIRQGGKPEVGAAEGIAALRVARAVMRANQQGLSIDLETFQE